MLNRLMKIIQYYLVCVCLVVPSLLHSSLIVHISMILVVGFSCNVHQLTPQNITRTEGDRDVLIPCIIPGYTVGSWQIKHGQNNVFKSYTPNEVFRANEQFIPKINIGIYIYEIKPEMNGTEFVCYYSNNSYLVTPTKVGILTVRSSSTCTSDLQKCYSTSISGVLLLQPKYSLSLFLWSCVSLSHVH